jgi:hypothetical protein
MPLRESKLRCAVNRDKQVKFAFFSAHFSDIDVEVADILYSSSDGVRGLGAAVKNLSHRASRNVASAWLIPRHSGTAQLGPDKPFAVTVKQGSTVLQCKILSHLGIASLC